MIIVQERWTAAEPGHLRQLLQAALPAGSRGHGPPELVLLPIGEHVPGLDESVALGAVRDAASGCGAVLAGALRLDVGTIGFLMAADGQLLLRTPKILPDWAEGYSDTPSALAEPAAFGIVKLPQGQVAMLVGEDATAAHLVRAAMWRGAEVVLNPSREFTDEQFGIRQQARMARAYENHLCLVTASPSSLARGGGFEERLPPASALYDEWALPVRASGAESFLRVSLDVEAVRRRRSEYFGNLCVSTRPTIYAPGYRAALGPATTARASSPARVVDWIAEGERRALARAAAHPRRSDAIDRYDILLGQVIPRHVTDATSAAAVISANVDHAIDLTCRFAAAPDTRLVVFPEFFLQGSRMGRMPQLFPIAGINLKSSPHIDRLARFAQDNRMHLCGAVLEIDDDWPGHLFNTAFILDDRGVLIHRYRKIQCADVFGFLDTTPGSILERYLDRYGYEALFPVADTRLGRLATAICFDMNFPELFRAYALRGAEVLLHPLGSPRSAADADTAFGHIPAVRAFENVAFVVSANFGPLDATAVDGPNGRWPSQVCDFEGRCLARAATDDECGVTATLDLAALRAQRRKPIRNFLAHLQSGLHAPDYAAADLWPLSHWEDRPLEHPKELVELEAETWRRMTASGRFEG